MTIPRRLILFLLFACLLSFKLLEAQSPTSSAIRLPAIISDAMVLQAGRPAALWGWAKPPASITAQFLDVKGTVLSSAQAHASADGRWSIVLPPLAPSLSGSLRFTCGSDVKTVSDVWTGEVWLASGQSNMYYPLGSNLPQEMQDQAHKEAKASQGAIRFFNVDEISAASPQDDVGGHWSIVDAGNIQYCSSVAWNFAVALREKIPVPVGMIVSAVSATSITQWMPKSALDESPPGPKIETDMLQQFDQTKERIKDAAAAEVEWRKANPTPDLQAINAKSRPTKPGSSPIYSEYYNGMIAGLQPYSLEGILWFQADGDMGIAFAYGDLIKAMISGWRKSWHSELPFFYVEMNNMREYPPKDPNQSNDALSIIRQQQQAALELPATDVACSIDLGLLEPEPHFPNKKPLGQRLALLALNDVYGQPCAAHSPAYDSMSVEGTKIRLHFRYAEGLRVRGGGPAIGFEIRAATGAWVWAQAQVIDQDMLVWNDQIHHPIEVHYAWSMNPLISMENGAGLPLRPFSTTVIRP